MQDLNQELTQHLEAGETVAIATIVRRKGSVPREVGAKMLVQRGGKISGTVGGGCGEAEVWRAALNVIDTHRPTMVQVDLTEEIAMESQGVCGGIFDVFVQPWHVAPGAETPAKLEMAQAITRSLESERAVALATVIAAGGAWRELVGQSMLAHENGETIGTLPLPGASAELTTLQIVQSAQTSIKNGTPHIERIADTRAENAWAEIFVEPFVPPPVLLIAGAGHIAAPLAAIAHVMNYTVSVTDDRASFASRERFPSAKQLLVSDIESISEKLPHYVAHSRCAGHARALARCAGSARHHRLSRRLYRHDRQPAPRMGCLQTAARRGHPAEKLSRVRAPIGLNFGSSTPEEIALGIMAEITMLRHGGTGKTMSEPLRERFMERLRRIDDAN